MELSINELNPNNVYNSYEPIPENTVPIKVVKKGVHFEEPEKPMHQSIPRSSAKIKRPNVVPQKPAISYEDILSKMGMFVADGKLHLIDGNHKQPQYKQPQYKQQNIQQNIPTNQPKYEDNPNIPRDSYIYNKYFSDLKPTQNYIRQPTTILEYRNMLINDIIQKQKIKQIKSTKLMMPYTNINLYAGNSSNLNKMFDFSKR
jgi:hypothetical protein